MARLSGLIPAAATPLLPGAFEVDHGGLVEHCRRLLSLGADGINLLGTTGEATSLAVEQRIAAMEAVAASGLPLGRFMVGTGTAALGDTVRLTQRAVDLGFAGALVLPPFFYKGVEEDGLAAYFGALVDKVGRAALRLYYYHMPQNTGVPCSFELIGRLRARWPETLIGLKDSSGDLAHAAGLARAHPGFDVFPSAEGGIRDMDGGLFAGVISATLNVTVPLVSKDARGADPGAVEAAVAIRAALSSVPLVPAVKSALADLTGAAAFSGVLPPWSPLSGERKAALGDRLATTRYAELGARFR